MTHKPSATSRHKVDKQARQARKRARRKMYKNLKHDPHTGYKRAR